MAKKLMNWKTKGMNKDLSVSAFNPEFSFENRNMRLSTNDSNTVMSWVNERGTAPIVLKEGETEDSLTLQGVPIGTAVINRYLIVFTTVVETGKDYIYRLEYKEEKKTVMKGTVLYGSLEKHGSLHFSIYHPLETLVSYEAEHIQKVYWVDGINQPRIINIAPDNDSNIARYVPTSFDFVPEMKLQEQVYIKKRVGEGGTFAPGVIQYAFTYYNKYRQESNIFYTSPLCYISPIDRGGAPDENVDNTFSISLGNLDTNFDYVRIYAIQRTSLNAIPFVRLVTELAITDGAIANYTDTGTSGATVDPTEMLFKNNDSIIASTMEQKDGTLFLGNLEISRPIPAKTSITLYDTEGSTTTHRTVNPMDVTTSRKALDYRNQLSFVNANECCTPVGGFKRGQTYRCGVQFQYKTGKWSNPVYVGDFTTNERVAGGFMKTSADGIQIPIIQGTLSRTDALKLIAQGYKKVRPLVVFPEAKDRTSICQGVICPTMYTTEHRGTGIGDNTNLKDIYAQSSWFFRCKISSGGLPVDNGAVTPWFLGSGYTGSYGSSGEFGNTGSTGGFIPYADRNTNPSMFRYAEIEGMYDAEHKFRVDLNTVTFHSPDVEFDEQLKTYSYVNTSARKVGDVKFTKVMSDIDIQTETPPITDLSNGFVHKSFTETGIPAGIVAGLFYDDYAVDDSAVTDKPFEPSPFERCSARWLVYPWHRQGSLNNDILRPAIRGTASAVLKKKVISNLRLAETTYESFSSINLATYPKMFASDEVSIVQMEGTSGVLGNYEGNIDTMLMPDSSDGQYFCIIGNTLGEFGVSGKTTPFNSNQWWKTWHTPEMEDFRPGLQYWNGTDWVNQEYSDHIIGQYFKDLSRKKLGVRMKYKSTPHLIMNFGGWGMNYYGEDYTLPIFEITKEVTGAFGGTTNSALLENTWIPCGEPVDIDNGSAVTIRYSYGDTYYQRYDCLKTYPFTPEDTNQIVEIGSFMLETYLNIDGRYDKNRGRQSNLYVTPQNFNLLNPVYTQKDNFFSYKMDRDELEREGDTIVREYPNQITWTLTKTSGAEVDLWTHLTMANVEELDGDKGEVRKLTRLNNDLLSFQDTGIAQVLYNESMQVSSTSGVPIEIANSGKVQGKRYLSDTVGCSNKWSLVTAPSGIYFMDSEGKNIFVLNGGLNNLSSTLGFNTWCKQNIPASNVDWTPVEYLNFVSYYDRLNQDILFIDSKEALAYSEKFGAFTSFYNYGGTPYFHNLEDTGVWIRRDGTLWKHQAGEDYCTFFGEEYPYQITLVGNPEPTTDKIFTNLEFRACVDDEGETDEDGRYTPYLPFDYLETWNEYQHGITWLKNMRGLSAVQHHTSDALGSLKRKFRMWRCDIPRDNFTGKELNGSVFSEQFNHVFRQEAAQRLKRPIDRMRNPWIYLKLEKQTDTTKRVEVHDLLMTYYN